MSEDVKSEFLQHLGVWPEVPIPGHLLDALQDCRDPLPTELFDVDGFDIGGAHEWIELPPGATYADAVQKIKRKGGGEHKQNKRSGEKEEGGKTDGKIAR